MRAVLPLLALAACVQVPAEGTTHGPKAVVAHAWKDTENKAVVALLLSDGLCSGTVIDPRAVLTAAHCVATLSPNDVVVYFGDDVTQDLDPARSVYASETWVSGGFVPGGGYSTHDVAIVKLADPAPVPPATIRRSRIQASEKNNSVRISGYGKGSMSPGPQTPTSGIKLQGNMRIDEVQADLLKLRPDGAAPCTGDSGGPVFTWVAGKMQVSGVASYAATHNCIQNQPDISYYARLDQDLPLLNNALSMKPGPQARAPEPCGVIDHRGACAGDILTWCADGELQVADCAGVGRSCGPLPGSSDDFDCLEETGDEPAGTEGCGGIDYYGACEGGVLQYCDEENDRLVTQDCLAAGLTCGWQNADVGNNCVEPEESATTSDACGGVTSWGTCEDDDLEYCDEAGQLAVSTCESGYSCDVVPGVGWDCVADAPSATDDCGGVTSDGECDEASNLLRYCWNGELVEVWCDDTGTYCADDGTGYYDCL